MKKFVIGMVIGTVVGTAIGVSLEAYGLAKAVIDEGVDITAVVRESYERGRIYIPEREPKINSWRRRYSTPERR